MSTAKKISYLLDPNPASSIRDGDVPSIIEIAPIGKKSNAVNVQEVVVKQNTDVIDPTSASIQTDEHTVTIWATNQSFTRIDQVVSEELFNIILKLSKQPAFDLNRFIQTRSKTARSDLDTFLERLSVRDETGKWILKNGVRLAIEVLGFEKLVVSNVEDPSNVADQVFALNDFQQLTGKGIAALKQIVIDNPEGWLNQLLPVAIPDSIPETNTISHYQIHFHFAEDKLKKS